MTRDMLRDRVDLALIETLLGKDFDPDQPRGPHTGEWIRVIGDADFIPPVGADQAATAQMINARRSEFEALPSTAQVQVWHGPAGAGSGASSQTYVTLNYYQARGFALGSEPIKLTVVKGDLKPSPEARAAGFESATDSLFVAGEAVVNRDRVANV